MRVFYYFSISLFKRDDIKLIKSDAKSAVKNPSILNPSTISDASNKRSVLITNANNPNVIIVIGNESR